MDQNSINNLRQRWLVSDHKNILEDILNGVQIPESTNTYIKVSEAKPNELISDLRGIPFDRKKIGELELDYSWWDYACFDYSQFEKTEFQNSVFNDVSFVGCEFHRTQMLFTIMNNVNFTDSIFSPSFMGWSKITNSNFNHTKFIKATLGHTDLSGNLFTQIHAEYSRFDWANLEKSDLTSSKFLECEFQMSFLTESNLTDTTFENCDLRGTDFRGAKLHNTRFIGGKFGIVSQGGEKRLTRFDDTPEARQAVLFSDTQNKDSIEWCPVVVESSISTEPAPVKLRGLPNETVPKTGWWFSPAMGSGKGRQYFNEGSKFPSTETTNLGMVIWGFESE